ncbi:Protein phosphatase 2C 7, partial [Tetrabaena socialis]
IKVDHRCQQHRGTPGDGSAAERERNGQDLAGRERRRSSAGGGGGADTLGRPDGDGGADAGQGSQSGGSALRSPPADVPDLTCPDATSRRPREDRGGKHSRSPSPDRRSQSRGRDRSPGDGRQGRHCPASSVREGRDLRVSDDLGSGRSRRKSRSRSRSLGRERDRDMDRDQNGGRTAAANGGGGNGTEEAGARGVRSSADARHCTPLVAGAPAAARPLVSFTDEVDEHFGGGGAGGAGGGLAGVAASVGPTEPHFGSAPTSLSGPESFWVGGGAPALNGILPPGGAAMTDRALGGHGGSPASASRTLGRILSLGDLDFKEPRRFVECEPDVTRLVPVPGDNLIVLASDGLWDVMGDQEAVDCANGALQARYGGARTSGGGMGLPGVGVAYREEDARAAAEALLESAIRRGTSDNVTCVVMLLQWD